MVFLAKGCAGCHSAPGIAATVRVGPDLNQLRTVAASRKPGTDAEAYVRESVVEPQAFVVAGYAQGGPGNPPMPTLPVSQSDLDALAAFLLGPP
jgi:mono/diheme cytochrome c family protein